MVKTVRAANKGTGHAGDLSAGDASGPDAGFAGGGLVVACWFHWAVAPYRPSPTPQSLHHLQLQVHVQQPQAHNCHPWIYFFIVNLQPQFSCLIDQGWSTPWEISGLILKSLNHMIFSNVGEVGVGWFPAILMRAGVLHCYCTTQVFGISCLSQREFIEK